MIVLVIIGGALSVLLFGLTRAASMALPRPDGVNDEHLDLIENAA